MTSIPVLSADELLDRISPSEAYRVIQSVLQDGVDPADDPVRSTVLLDSGRLNTLAAERRGYTGTKLVTVADNPRRHRNRVQGVFMLMDSETLTPRLLIHGAALTGLRTAATSAAAVDRLADPRASRLLVFGAGAQAREHIEAMQAIRPLTHVVIHSSDAYHSEGLAAFAVERGLQARIGQATPVTSSVPEADIIVCATSGTEPLFDGSLVRNGTVVVAVGSLEPTKRELEGSLLGRSDVYVEDRATAMRDAGDLIMAVEEGHLDPAALRTLAELERGEAPRSGDRPAVVKTVGMAWEDLAVAIAAHEARGNRTARR